MNEEKAKNSKLKKLFDNLSKRFASNKMFKITFDKTENFISLKSNGKTIKVSYDGKNYIVNGKPH